jgi:hypothetical protein
VPPLGSTPGLFDIVKNEVIDKLPIPPLPLPSGISNLLSPGGIASLVSPGGIGNLISPGGIGNLLSPGGIGNLLSPGGIGNLLSPGGIGNLLSPGGSPTPQPAGPTSNVTYDGKPPESTPGSGSSPPPFYSDPNYTPDLPPKKPDNTFIYIAGAGVLLAVLLSQK